MYVMHVVHSHDWQQFQPVQQKQFLPVSAALNFDVNSAQFHTKPPQNDTAPLFYVNLFGRSVTKLQLLCYER